MTRCQDRQCLRTTVAQHLGNGLARWGGVSKGETFAVSTYEGSNCLDKDRWIHGQLKLGGCRRKFGTFFSQKRDKKAKCNSIRGIWTGMRICPVSLYVKVRLLWIFDTLWNRGCGSGAEGISFQKLPLLLLSSVFSLYPVCFRTGERCPYRRGYTKPQRCETTPSIQAHSYSTLSHRNRQRLTTTTMKRVFEINSTTTTWIISICCDLFAPTATKLRLSLSLIPIGFGWIVVHANFLPLPFLTTSNSGKWYLHQFSNYCLDWGVRGLPSYSSINRAHRVWDPSTPPCHSCWKCQNTLCCVRTPLMILTLNNQLLLVGSSA